MSIPQWFAGQILLADDMNARHPRLVQQENDQTVTASTTPVASEITFTPEPNALYEYKLLLAYSATTAAGIFWEWNASGATFCSFSQATEHPGTSGLNTGQSVVFRRAANTTNREAGGTDTTSPPVNFHSAYDQGTFTTDGTTSSVTLQFAQATSTAVDTILRGGNQTRMLYYRIG